MDSQFPATKEDLYHVQMDIKHVQAVQTNHADRLLRLEKRQADDAALKSVWGPGSPFPGVLSGTPQQGSSFLKPLRWSTVKDFVGPVQNPPTDVFEDFDDEQGQNLLGSLQLETDEEPVRRGASRANSVRFDVSALQGSNWAQGSRASGDFSSIRPGSSLGSHHMMERTLSHKSDGRHSSAGHSIHSVPSGRTSSLGLDTNFLVGNQHDDDSPLDIPEPPPGLFILGSVPSIIRCWLTTNFSHNALLYCAVCTGSQRSVLDYSLVKDLGLSDQVFKQPNGLNCIRLPVYLPEAVITQPNSRSNSPAPQLPTLTADFEIVGQMQRLQSDRKVGIRVFIGSDTLRAHNADVLFSRNCMTLYGDDRNKLSVPFVRPEDETVYQNLCTANIPPEKAELKATAAPFTPTELKSKLESVPSRHEDTAAREVEPAGRSIPASRSSVVPDQSPSIPNEVPDSSKSSTGRNTKSSSFSPNGNTSDSETQYDTSDPIDISRRESSSGIWGSWRQGGTSAGSDNGESTSGYQRATRGGRNMKVLKPSKSMASAAVSSRSSSSVRTGSAYEPAPTRPSGESSWHKSQPSGSENQPLKWDSKKAGTEENKGPRSVGTLPRSSNPVGGASAFAWMNPGKPKTSTTAE